MKVTAATTGKKISPPSQTMRESMRRVRSSVFMESILEHQTIVVGLNRLPPLAGFGFRSAGAGSIKAVGISYVSVFRGLA